MQVDKLIPETGKVYVMDQYTLIHILEGTGAIQVDFRNYLDWDDKLIFLDKGQYISFLAPGFVVRKIGFPDEIVFSNKEVRVLFKHLVSLGYISFRECEDCRRYLGQLFPAAGPREIIDTSVEQWYWQNPFHTGREEYGLIFDLKDVIDSEYRNHLSTERFCALVRENGYRAQALVQDKIGLTVHRMASNKLLLEGQRRIAFSDDSVKTVAYELGYKDPAYFSRFFRRETGRSPGEFRALYQEGQEDPFLDNIFELIREHHDRERELGFYADQLHMSVKTLSRKVREKLNLSLGQLLRRELVRTAIRMLDGDAQVADIAFHLGFNEPNHFSAFFRHHTGMSPTEFRREKYPQ